RSSNIYFDSTFKSVPEIFYQLFVTHGEYKNVLIPYVFSLMERKTEIMFRRVVEKVPENVEITCQTAIVRSIGRTEDTFIGRHHRTGRSQILFPLRLWNQSERTENGISRTNNKVESWPNAFARLVEGNHTNIFKFLASLQKELSLVDIKIDTIHIRTTQQNTRHV
ncbi:hypothetical protein HZS_5344, partial [Henneguya salminicola]